MRGWVPAPGDACMPELEAIRERASAAARYPLAKIAAIGDADAFVIVAASAMDVPVLVSVLEKILDLHSRQEKPVRCYDLDLRCEAHDPAVHVIMTHREWAAVRDCPDCAHREAWVCSHCNCPDDQYPCKTRRIIMEALGE